MVVEATAEHCCELLVHHRHAGRKSIFGGSENAVGRRLSFTELSERFGRQRVLHFPALPRAATTWGNSAAAIRRCPAAVGCLPSAWYSIPPICHDAHLIPIAPRA
jgi:hypothetical protein